MTPEEIASTLAEIFDSNSIEQVEPGSWQILTADFRLLVLLSQDGSWLRALLPILPIQQAQPFLEQFLLANFDETQEVRYALQNNVLWGVYQHNTNSLFVSDLSSAISRLVALHQAGLNNVFSQLIDARIRQIVLAAKMQGQSLEATMQNLDRFYAEGLMGDIGSSQAEREANLAAWRRQLERLWLEVEP